ncbi:MAG: prepilin peptidase [Gammaproteobacteria bacterium]|nr:MAG: prepilin peptidase [Gammaproteobacteria bacterium]
MIPWPLLLLSAALLGLVVGSFLNVVIHRLPIMLERRWRRECATFLGQEVEEGARLDLLYPPSHCPHCGHRIKAGENIPLLSYLLLRGRCSACRAPISPRYPLVEFLTAALSVLVVWRFGPSLQAAFALPLVWALIALSFIDLDRQILPDEITLPVLWAGLLASLIPVFADPESSILGAAAGYLLLWGVYQAFRLLTGKEGMGYGDFKLLALLGAWLGWQALPLIILIASLAGSLVGIALILLKGHHRDTPIPFGPFLALGGFIALLWGQEIMRFWI